MRYIYLDHKNEVEKYSMGFIKTDQLERNTTDYISCHFILSSSHEAVFVCSALMLGVLF